MAATLLFMASKKGWIGYTVLALAIIGFIILRKIVSLYPDYLWFQALGFEDIFTTILFSKLVLFGIGALIFFVFALLNLFIASRFHKPRVSWKIMLSILTALALVRGLFMSTIWLEVLQYMNRATFGIADPIFAKDVSFYVFSLPFYMSLWNLAYGCLKLTLIVVAVYYLQHVIALALKKFANQDSMGPSSIPPGTAPPPGMGDHFNFRHEISKIKTAGLTHLAILGSFVFILFAIKHYLSRFSVMYSESGIVVGAGYTDVMVFLPLLKILMVLAVIVAILFYVWIFYLSKVGKADALKFKKRHVILIVLVVYVVIASFGKLIVPAIVQGLVVSPNEFNLEKQFIDNNIRFTKLAYGLDAVDEQDFSVQQSITPQVLEDSRATIDNVRILDWRPLTQTYKQTQEIRLYYDLSGIDIDRYNIDGKYTQVMIAPRELDQKQITENAQTWVNLHQVYTHGFGVVMSPVNKVTKEGLPEYIIQDIPPVYSVDDDKLKIDQPRIYYGEKDNNYVLVKTDTDEFDYPKGNSNEYISYDGKGGVVLDTFMKKFLMAIRFADLKILLSSDVNPQSKIMFRRNIQQRINAITPFLTLDRDPYLVIDSGRLYWIQDAYTTTGNYPYSQKSRDINYIRNSVKVVVDAYDGDVTYYVVDTEDPLIKVFASIFPGQFSLAENMPEGLKTHMRYPEDLFKIQSQIYTTYHMNDTNVFYNKEDAWQIPYEIYGSNEKVRVEPYYIIMKLPDESRDEFVLMTTFTPIKKDNMVAWLAARSDGEHYGKLLLYKFPKDKLVYGPLQIEAKIDQDSEISQQLTLWSQQGSHVARGNLLVIPVGESLLYIEPLYMQAETGQLPELKRVIVSDGERVVMERDLGTALVELFGKGVRKTNISGAVDGNQTSDMSDSSLDELVVDANIYYDYMLKSMQSADWTEFGKNFDMLGEVLAEMNDK